MAKQLTLSPTKVDTFMGCRRLFKYKYIAQPFVPPQNKYFVIGNIAHKALELYHKTRTTKDALPPEGGWGKFMGSCLKQAMNTEHAARHLNRGTITKDDLRAVRDMLKKYVHYIKKVGAPDVHTVEKLAKINVEGIAVWLKADRIDNINDGGYRVVDYKSGQAATKKSERESVQIPSYGLYIQQRVDKNAKDIIGEYCYVKQLDSKKGISSHTVTQEWMNDAVLKYKSVHNEITNGCKFTQNFKYKYCFFCDFKQHCLEDDNNGV
jgi:hypothetical protein